MRRDFPIASTAVLVLAAWLEASVAWAAEPPKHTLCIIEDVPATVDSAVAGEWRSEVAEFRSLLEQVKHVDATAHPEFTFRQFAITKHGSGEWLSLTHRAWFQPGNAAASQIWPPSKCDSCPLSHMGRLFLQTVQSKLFDAQQGLYRPYAVKRCERAAAGNVIITVEPANGLRLEPNIYYFVGEWRQQRGTTPQLKLSATSLAVKTPADDRLQATFEVGTPPETRDRFFNTDCVGVPPTPIVLVPRLVMPLVEGTRNTKVQ